MNYRSLKEIQEKFQSDILDGNQRIYSEMYFTRLHDILAEDFVAVKKFLECETFEAVAVEYIRKYPSKFTNINEFPKYFPLFLSEHYLIEEVPFLADLADLEWKIRESFVAKDVDVVEGLSEEKAMTLRYLLSPSTRLTRSNWSIGNWWRAREEEDAVIEEETTHVLVSRPELEVMVEDITGIEFGILNYLKKPRTLDELSSFVEGLGPRIPIGELFSKWLGNRVITTETE